MEETVPFDHDLLGGYYDVCGYQLCVHSYEIMDYDEYLKAHNIDPSVLPHYTQNEQKVAVLRITLSNIDSDAEGIMLTELHLHGIDSSFIIDRGLLSVLNPVLENQPGVHLAPGSSREFMLPFNMPRSLLQRSWSDLTHYQLYLTFTSFPVQKEIELS